MSNDRCKERELPEPFEEPESTQECGEHPLEQSNKLLMLPYVAMAPIEEEKAQDKNAIRSLEWSPLARDFSVKGKYPKVANSEANTPLFGNSMAVQFFGEADAPSGLCWELCEAALVSQ